MLTPVQIGSILLQAPPIKTFHLFFTDNNYNFIYYQTSLIKTKITCKQNKKTHSKNIRIESPQSFYII